ncbi:MAG: FecR family protein [Bacteroidia bacterium]
MDNKEFYKLIEKYNAGSASAEEISFLEAYYNLFDQQPDTLETLTQVEKEKLKQEIADQIHFKISEPEHKSSFMRFKWLAIAAVLTILSTLALIFTPRKDQNDQLASVKSKAELPLIVPGSNQAVLTLANGKSITLNDKANGVLAKEAGVVITKNRDGLLQYTVTPDAEYAINTISTPRGGQYQLILVDGTKVWLNAASSITFPTKFDGKERNVEITGEAYFEVEKNIKLPFKVKTKHQLIEVLGTHFNINTYEDELADKTTLLEGSVKVSKVNSGAVDLTNSKILKPGQQATISGAKPQIIVSDADEDEAIAWKKGYFKFNRSDIQTIMRQVSRWYNVDVEYQGPMYTDLFGGKINRSQNVEEVLRILKMGEVNVTIKGRTIVISK